MTQSVTADRLVSTFDGTPISIEQLASDFRRDGYVNVRGLLTDDEIDELQAALVSLQEGVARGELDREKYSGDYLTSGEDGSIPFVNYVKDVTHLSETAHDAFHNPVLRALLAACFGGAEPWSWSEAHGRKFGVVYQDARPGQESGYTRIGWHSDHQAYPTSDFFPSIALTFHLDATSPANGFLRVVPGSHEGGTDEMPLGFEKIDGEIGVYCERGDVLLHHSDLWHSAARATEDPPGGIRRHMRGGWNVGRRPGDDEELEAFNKNAAR
jgi:hypothetical protein